MNGFLAQAFVYLAAAVVAVPLAKRLGLGSVLGYLLAGVVIGPLAGLVGAETRDLQHFAELGVVMMLFLVGLELEPRTLWRMRSRLLGLGGLQVLGTGALLAGAALLLGVPPRASLAIGLVLSLSSTAIVLQTLGERGWLKTEGGRASFAVLLFQDIAVIPMLALLPLLAVVPAAGAVPDAHAAELSLLDRLPPWAQAPVVLVAVAVVVLGGHFLSRPLFRLVAQARLRELFTATALLLVVAIALLMMLVGLSPALGTFLAGVVLADSEYRHELESDIEPFKGLLLGLFFITVGAGIDVRYLAAHPGAVAGLTLGLVAVKALALAALARAFALRGREALLLSLGLAQAGEFCFVLLGYSVQSHVFTPALAQLLSLAVALSMLLTPVLFILVEVVASRLGQGERAAGEPITEAGTVLIAGHGRFGQIVNRLLLGDGHRTVVLDQRSEQVEGMRRFGVRTFYGDATRPDLLHAAGLADVQVLVVAIDDAERATALVEHARRERPDLCIVARAIDRRHLYALTRAGATVVVRETFDSAVRAGRAALEGLGLHPFRAERIARVFVRHDLESIARLSEVWDPAVSVFENPRYLAIARERTEVLAAALRGAQTVLHDRTERGWTPPPKRGAAPVTPREPASLAPDELPQEGPLAAELLE